MKGDFQKRMDIVLEELGESRPRLLLHCCCGPCSTYVLEYLCRNFELTALFFNPNIYPAMEYEKRRFWFESVVNRYGGNIQIMPDVYEPERFDEISRGLEAEREGGARCAECFRLRLRETARLAAEGGFRFFCSTLSVSPHKDAGRINDIGMELEGEFGVCWLPSDFKKREGYKRATQLSREYGLYRQDYCGCKFSMERDLDE